MLANPTVLFLVKLTISSRVNHHLEASWGNRVKLEKRKWGLRLVAVPKSRPGAEKKSTYVITQTPQCSTPCRHVEGKKGNNMLDMYMF